MQKHEAYWITPDGQISSVHITHIAEVIDAPGRFGVTLEMIKETYGKYNEPLGWEGRARQDIMRDLLLEGWIRIREKQPGLWIAQTGRWDNEIKDNLVAWKRQMLAAGVSPYDEVEIEAPDFQVKASLKELLE